MNDGVVRNLPTVDERVNVLYKKLAETVEIYGLGLPMASVIGSLAILQIALVNDQSSKS